LGSVTGNSGSTDLPVTRARHGGGDGRVHGRPGRPDNRIDAGDRGSRPPGRFAVDASAEGSAGRGRHNYRPANPDAGKPGHANTSRLGLADSFCRPSGPVTVSRVCWCSTAVSPPGRPMVRKPAGRACLPRPGAPVPATPEHRPARRWRGSPPMHGRDTVALLTGLCARRPVLQPPTPGHRCGCTHPAGRVSFGFRSTNGARFSPTDRIAPGEPRELSRSCKTRVPFAVSVGR
jgi:hypothetical protein